MKQTSTVHHRVCSKDTPGSTGPAGGKMVDTICSNRWGDAQLITIACGHSQMPCRHTVQQYFLSLGIRHMTLAQLEPCSTSCTRGVAT